MFWFFSYANALIGNTGGYTPYSFNWERRKGLNGSWFTVSTAGPTYQELDSTKIDTYYRITITSDQGCGTVITPVQKFRVNALPGDDSWSILGPDEVCSGASGSITSFHQITTLERWPGLLIMPV